MEIAPLKWVALAVASSSSLAQEPRPGGPEGREGRGGPPGGMFPPSLLLTALDADGDGELSDREIDNAAAALPTLDRDEDDKLTRDEMLSAFRERGMGGGPGGPGGPGGQDASEVITRIMAFDTNGDGKLSKDELPERMRALMDRADVNEDGLVDKGDLIRIAQPQAGRGQGSGPGGRGGSPSREGGRGPD